jgi:hypothetical protein
MSKFARHKWWFVTLLLSLPVIAVAAVPNLFTPNTVLKASALNQNFDNLDKRLAALEANADVGGGCYVHWGVAGCAAGYSEVVKGHSGGFESFPDTPAGAASDGNGNIECVADSAAVRQSFSGTSYPTRMMIGSANAAGMSMVAGACSVCCRSGCYTAFGTSSCATGYTPTYKGRVGGVEAFNGNKPFTKTLCLDGTAAPVYMWAGYTARLMRHRNGTASGNTDGMDSVDNSCAVCCR